MQFQSQWDEARWNLMRAEHPIDYLINVTPTGDARNHLTEANIHLKIAIEAIEKAYKAAKDH